jgi:DNA-binding NarL/FixJ family response regulator
LWGAASALRDSIHDILPPSYEGDRAPHLERARTALGPQAFARAWAEGRGLTPSEVQGLVESPWTEDAAESSAAKAEAGPLHPDHYGLTPREVEVLRLVATGLSDALVADKLVISPRTVGKHLQSIYSKLYLPSRSAATRWALEHGLG